MWSKILRTLLIYSGLLILGNIAVSLFFAYLFGSGSSPLIEVPFNLLFAWLAGYYGVKSLSKTPEVNKVLGSPFWQGVSITLFASLLGAVVVYLLTQEITFGQGLAITLIGGFGGKRAASGTNKPLGKIGKIVTWIFLGLVSLAVLVVVGNVVLYKLNDVKTIQQGEMVHYEDKKFGYSFDYPKSWKRSTYPFAQGQVTITSDKDTDTNLYFWYKDSGKVSNMNELLAFVKDDAKYGEDKQGAKTESIEQKTLNGKDVAVWTSKYEDGTHSKVYYFADFQPLGDQVIYIWIAAVNTKNKTEPTEKATVDLILNSFKFLQ
ncbi:MAG: hypothetical protein HYV37_03380 [Candidatus Levyibacteriota bacterium]|nr:MAG: hypothetical protein HYV37_03380 [Candidatus Levybacteria bacterium]